MTDYYRRDGTPLPGALAWARYCVSIDRRVARAVLGDGKVVSTVYIGLDLSMSLGALLGLAPHRPLIFETMVFSEVAHPTTVTGRVELFHESLDCDRYSTEEEALAGHGRMVQKWMSMASDPSGGSSKA